MSPVREANPPDVDGASRVDRNARAGLRSEQSAEAAGPAAGPAGGDALGLPLDRAEAMVPADLLQGGEIVILLLKPSPLYILLAAAGHLALIVGVVLGLGYFGVLTDRETMVLMVGLVSARLIWQFFEWLSRLYILTDRRVIRIRGVLRVLVFEAQLKQLQHTQSSFSIRERLFALGTISFSTAGTGLPEAYWVMLRQPLAVHRQVIQAINRYG